MEELDPLERMRRRYGLDRNSSSGAAAGGAMPSLEEELEQILKKVDIHKFDYKPVPREPDE